MVKSRQEQKEKQYFIEYLRVIACIAVVLIHTCYIGYQSQHMPYDVEIGKRMIYMVVNNISLFAVPIFLMISGYLFLSPERDISIRKMYGKYVARILGCLIVFGIYLIHPLFINLAYKALKVYPMRYEEWISILFLVEHSL